MARFRARPPPWAGLRVPGGGALRPRARYANYAGTGNTLNANESVVRRMIVDSLRYWVAHMHVDGFRFDLASVLSRDESGSPLQRPPVLWDIQSDPILAGTKLTLNTSTSVLHSLLPAVTS